MSLTRRIVASTTGGATAISFRFGSYDVRARPPPPLAGMQPSSGRKLASARVVRATKTAERVVVTPGTDRAAEGAEERELERAGAIRVEPADDLAAPGTGELVVGRRAAARHLHPRALDRDADDQPVALRSRARRRRAEARDRGGDSEHQQRAPHGSLPKRNAETAPAASSRKAPPAAKPAVISRSFLTLPIREPSSS